MTTIERGRLAGAVERGRLAGAVEHSPAGQPQVDHHPRRTELAVSIVLAAWAVVLLCGYLAGAVP